MSAMEDAGAGAGDAAAAAAGTVFVSDEEKAIAVNGVLTEQELDMLDKSVQQFRENVLSFLCAGSLTEAELDSRLSEFKRIIPLFTPWSLRSRTKEEVIERADMFGFALAFETDTAETDDGKRVPFTFLCIAKKNNPGSLVRVQVILFGNERAEGGTVQYKDDKTTKKLQNVPRSERAKEDEIFYVVPLHNSDEAKKRRYSLKFVVEGVLKSFEQCSCTFSEGTESFWKVRNKLRERKAEERMKETSEAH